MLRKLMVGYLRTISCMIAVCQVLINQLMLIFGLFLLEEASFDLPIVGLIVWFESKAEEINFSH